MVSQSVREIVKISDFLTVEFDENIASTQTCFIGRTTGANIGKSDAFRRFIEVRYAAKVGSITGPGAVISLVTAVSVAAGGLG